MTITITKKIDNTDNDAGAGALRDSVVARLLLDPRPGGVVSSLQTHSQVLTSSTRRCSSGGVDVARALRSLPPPPVDLSSASTDKPVGSITETKLFTPFLVYHETTTTTTILLKTHKETNTGKK